MEKHYYDDYLKKTTRIVDRNLAGVFNRTQVLTSTDNLGGNTDLSKNPKPMPTEGVKKSTGGPSEYYDMPFSDWITVNDMAEHLAEHKWGKYGIHLKDIFKGLCRWGEKSGTTIEYDTRKIIYYGVRIYKMLVGAEKTRTYLKELLEDKQFGGDK